MPTSAPAASRTCVGRSSTRALQRRTSDEGRVYAVPKREGTNPAAQGEKAKNGKLFPNRGILNLPTRPVMGRRLQGR